MKIPKETCNFIKKYLRYEAEGADGIIFKFGGLNYLGFAIKTLSNSETISFYQDKGVKLRHDHIVHYGILLLLDDKIKICDLDRACCFDDVDKLKSIDGTIRYMAPETLARGNKLNEKTDTVSAQAAAGPLGPLTNAIGNLLTNIIKIVKQLLDQLLPTVNSLLQDELNNVKQLLNQIITNLQTILDRLLDGLLQVLGNGSTGLLGSVNDLLNSVVGSLSGILGSVGQVVSGLTGSLGLGKREAIMH
uniref:Uncharacterized protein n=1 Tax=Acrobeloides nanus TaxID=290746 RepID=A0A914DW76_9BILA